MNHPQIDIIVPVWNEPEETRQCLARLREYSPEVRFILLDNASDRETENLLQVFAEALDERALLFRFEKTIEFVTLVNKGLQRAAAPLLVVLKNTTMVRKGWLEPLLKVIACRSEAGVLFPGGQTVKGGAPAGKRGAPVDFVEVSHGDFAAVLITKKLYDTIGGFDEGMDGGIWCLKDYSRRAWQVGYLTVQVPGAAVSRKASVQLGSPVKREARVRESMDTFHARWGEEQSYCLLTPRCDGPEDMVRLFELLLARARRGDTFTVLVRSEQYREIVKARYDQLHENVVVRRLPLLFASRTGEKFFNRLRKDIPHIRMIRSTDELIPAFAEQVVENVNSIVGGRQDA